ncbi:MAG: hypothetical protein IPO63_11720 [Bacteroidetes bacterium]|nr:hypothetical protein [Bacteroidota bacterium]
MKNHLHLKQSTGDTLVAQACATIDGFNALYKRFEKRMETSGRSPSTLQKL